MAKGRMRIPGRSSRVPVAMDGDRAHILDLDDMVLDRAMPKDCVLARSQPGLDF